MVVEDFSHPLEELNYQTPFEKVMNKINSGPGVVMTGFPELFHLWACTRNFNQYLIDNNKDNDNQIGWPSEQIITTKDESYDGKATYTLIK